MPEHRPAPPTPPTVEPSAGVCASGLAALQALTAAALLLPGLALAEAASAPGADDSVALQSGHFQESARPLGAVPNRLQPLRAHSLVLKSTRTLAQGDELQLGYAQDTWSGATPVATAPAVAQGNRPLQVGSVGQLITVGASPMINGRVAVDAAGQPVQRDATTGRWQAAPALVHTLSSASPETRQQLDLRVTRRQREGSWSLGGSVSVERDYRSGTVQLGRRLDFDNQLSSLTLGLSATRSDSHATLDHDAAPYITKTAYRAQIDNRQGLQVLNGRRHDVSAALGYTRVLGPAALWEVHASHTQHRGDLSNPYKLSSVIFAPTAAADADGVVVGDLQALLEQRPKQRRLWNLGTRLVLHHEASDAALHLGLDLHRDDWGIATHRLDAAWYQPLPGGWMLTPRLRYQTQTAARFYTPYLVSRQAWRQVSVSADGQISVTPFDPRALPAHFSSDQRLAAFGSLGYGLALSKALTPQLNLDLGLDWTRQSGRLKWGGGGEGPHGDLRYATLQATLRLALGGSALPAESGNMPAHETHEAHSHVAAHTSDPVPAGVMLVHGTPAPGQTTIGLRLQTQRDGGALRRGRTPVSDAEVIAQACAPAACTTAPSGMNMRMWMLDLGFHLRDDVSLMLMPQLMQMRMDSRLLEGAGFSDTPAHIGRHESAGLGDTAVHALLNLPTATAGRWQLGLGLSVPTGDTGLLQRRTHQQAPAALDYGMQTGSGTWDLLPSVTAQGARGAWSWGAQLAATLRLQSANRDAYALGDRWAASAWTGLRLAPALATTLRWSWNEDGAIKGQRLQAAGGPSPADAATNQGRRLQTLGLGLNIDTPRFLAGAGSLGLEWSATLRDSVRGVQLPRRDGFSLHWHVVH